MARRILWRLVNVVPLLFVISLLVFFISQAGPADPVRGALSQKMSPAQIEQIRQAYGLDRPAWAQ
jgi:peptide/nickel transport system permease protein